MDIQISHSAVAATAAVVPDFPLVRFDTGMVVYQEALINGQYMVANTSACGRPKPREWIWPALSGGAGVPRPPHTRRHAFQLEVDGQLLADRWEWSKSYEAGSPRPDCRECVVVLRHTQRPILLQVHTLLDDTPFITRWLVIQNTCERPVALAHVYPWAGALWDTMGHPWVSPELHTLGQAPFTLGRFTESTAGNEGAFDWVPLPSGSYAYESLEGRSGWGAPWGVVRNAATGETCVLALAWSGNWRIEFSHDYEPARRPVCDAQLCARVGLAGPAPLRVLEAGESVTTPAVHLGFLLGDLDACIQALHAHERRSVVLPQPAGREHRVEVNHTGYTRNAQITEAQLYEEIDVAADVGVELFLLDAGWFGGVSEPWWETVGDWGTENPLLPHGVRAAFDRAHTRGLLCGLWVEAERLGPRSQLLRGHADWQMERRRGKIPNLDLSRPEVAAYLERTIVGLVERYALDCFRLDYNISVGEGGEAQRGGYTENVLWRYYDALYGIFERLHARYPNLLLENCSSGGGRTDLGMLSRFHWTQVTDKWTPGPTAKIINGMTLSLPPELCETLLGAISDGVADLDFTLRIGLFGHFCVSGIFPSLAARHTLAREHWQHTIALYKRFVRPMLSSSRLYHHTPIQRQTEPGDWLVLECASKDARRAYAGIFRLGAANGEAYRFYPRGLDAGLRYSVSFDGRSGSREMDGGALMDQGLRVPVPGAFTSALLLFEAL